MTHRTFDEQIASLNRVVSSWDINQEYKVALLGMIASLGYEHEKSITPEPHWIPVTERLPKPRESVIISVNGKYGDWIGEGCYWETTENHVIWKGYRWNATYWDDEIIAWMPLPEPYKGVTE